MPPEDGGLETRPTGNGETVGVGRNSYAAQGWRVRNPPYAKIRFKELRGKKHRERVRDPPLDEGHRGEGKEAESHPIRRFRFLDILRDPSEGTFQTIVLSKRSAG